MSVELEERSRKRPHVVELPGQGKDHIIEVDEEGKVSVPGEDRRRGLALTLPADLEDYVRQLCTATKTPTRAFLAVLATSQPFKEAVEASGQKLVADHMADLYQRLGQKPPEGK